MIKKEEALQILEKYKDNDTLDVKVLKQFIDVIYNSIGTCKECKHYKDYRKCPMADENAMDEKNYCYAFYSNHGVYNVETC